MNKISIFSGSGRGCGKTTRLLFEAYKTGAIICCSSLKACQWIEKLAKIFKIDIKKPITYNDYLTPEKWYGIKNPQILIDDLDLFFRFLTKNRNPEVIGFSLPASNYSPDEEFKDVFEWFHLQPFEIQTEELLKKSSEEIKETITKMFHDIPELEKNITALQKANLELIKERERLKNQNALLLHTSETFKRMYQEEVNKNSEVK